MFTTYIAHKTENELQTVKEHSVKTGEFCKLFAIEPLKNITGQIGLFHDLGKYQDSFQKRINGKDIKVEHSTCGALEFSKLAKYPPTKLIADYCIVGHHTGLPDGGTLVDTEDMPTLQGRLKRKVEPYNAYKSELGNYNFDEGRFIELLTSDETETKEELIDKFAFFTRYVFSCLTDADSMDTSNFYNGENCNKLKSDYEKCLKDVNHIFDGFSCVTPLQKSRNDLQKQVYENVEKPADVYCINMPTGSGKTLCSIKVALKKAIEENKKRIIYVIPYNSIIDQTIDVFERAFGSHAQILRHQSSFSYDDDDSYSEDYSKVARLTMENWDGETIIVTTAVQFFESIYKNKRRNLRKMHNMQDSIIIFDEVHLLPIEFLQPCLQAIAYITRYLNSTALFLSATMPDFEKLFRKYSLKNIKTITPIDINYDFSNFKKCSYFNIGENSLSEIIEKASCNPSSLIIVNQKKTARQIFDLCSGKKYHLSTYMTAIDRQNMISEIKKELDLLERDYPDMKNVPEDRKILIVSTSLIEAGVDLDVYTVFRELTSLDSILQSGGRCNREGKRKNGSVYIFSLQEDKYRKKNIKTVITESLINKYEDISDRECIDEFFEKIYTLSDEEIQKHSMSKLCCRLDDIPFATYAKSFNLINSDRISIVIPEDDYSKNLISRVETGEYTEGLNRKLQKYTCSVSQGEFEELLKQNVLAYSEYGFYYLCNDEYYKKFIGILFEAVDYFI